MQKLLMCFIHDFGDVDLRAQRRLLHSSRRDIGGEGKLQSLALIGLGVHHRICGLDRPAHATQPIRIIGYIQLRRAQAEQVSVRLEQRGQGALSDLLPVEQANQLRTEL